MARRSGTAILPLHGGRVPPWLASRMASLGAVICQAIVHHYGRDEFLRRLSHPFWFQSFGAVLGMDWHSSGVTTSVMGALKRSINPNAKQLGLYVCGGKGKFSKETPAELVKIAATTGLDGNELVYNSKLSAKVDNTAIQDGFQLYTHNFILTDKEDWAVVQQGMHPGYKTARRYHWHSDNLSSFVEEPHTAVCGRNQGQILNLTASEAGDTKQGIMSIVREQPERMIREFQHLVMPSHHEVFAGDVNLKRLGTVLWLAHEQELNKFEDLLL